MTTDSEKNYSALPPDIEPIRKPWYLNANWQFLLFNAVFVVIFFGILQDVMRTALRSKYDSYIPFIPFISGYFLYTDRKKIFLTASFVSFGFLPAVMGILLFFLGKYQADIFEHRDYLAIMAFSAILIWIGGFMLCYGIKTARAAIFPLMFLVFMVPIPGAALEKIILFLQSGSAEVSYRFLQTAGIPVIRDGFTFHLPNLSVQVAPECSGIRSSLALFITGVLAAYLFLRTKLARALLMISIIPIAVIKNGMRIFTLTTLGAYWNKSILDSDLHTKGGFIFFILALLLVWAIIALLRRAEMRSASRKE